MKTRLNINITKCYKPMFAALAVTYFGFHMMNGDRGVYAFFRESHQQKLLEQELASVTSKREALEVKVSHLRNDSLDLDLLDEQSRRMLGMMGEGEKMILLESTQ